MPIQYIYNTSFSLKNETDYSKWLTKVIESEQCVVGEIVYAFFNDNNLKTLNNKYLGHNYYTDVLSFNDSCEKRINGNIAISVDRVNENAKTFGASFDHEMLRVMVHGLLHFMGYNDSNKDEKSEMTKKENEKIKMFHVER
jgi:probable rRNA maturation factor